MEQENYKIILDIPSESPAMGFEQYAVAFRDLIERSKPQFSIGIFGGWGSGKTTLMQAIDHLLKKKNYIVRVPFNAWRYEREEHLIVPLLDAVRESLIGWSEEQPGQQDTARSVASTIGKATRSLLAGFSLKAGMPGAFDVTLDANKALAEVRRIDKERLDAVLPKSFYYASFSALSKEFDTFVKEDPRRRIVVFVDDLDRCLPEGALEVIESMKLFFDLPGFVFVVGLNQTVVAALIDAKYGTRQSTVASESTENQPLASTAALSTGLRVSGDEYIKKIFQVPFPLPPVSVGNLRIFLDAMYEEAALSDEQEADLREVVEDHLRYVVTEEGVNPREVKRYINAYTVQIKAKPDLDRRALLAFQTVLSFRSDWATVRGALRQYGKLFTSTVLQEIQGERGALEGLDPGLKGISDTSFWTYVSLGAPGYPLLTAEPFNDYVYAGTGESFHDASLLNSFPKIGEMRERLRMENLNDPLGWANQFSVSSFIEHAAKMKHDMSLYSSEPLGATLIGELDAVMEAAKNITDASTRSDIEGINEARSTLEHLLNRIRDHLISLYNLRAELPIA